MAPPAIASALPLIPASAPPAPADPYAFMSAASTGFPLHAAAAAASSASLYAHHSLLAGAGNGIPAGPFQIRILGVPTVGAKSRVETQIKLCLQLVSASACVGKRRCGRGGARLVEPSSMSEERDTLWLHGKVICASDPEKIVKVCSGCVQRETKRASRRKYPPKPLPADPVTLPTPPASVSNSPTPRPASATAPANPPVSDILMSERKTMLIHAPPVLDFASGDAMLPLRIPCYCRHHKEKLGFILQFELRDTQGRVVAKGESAPILITDDHKTSKKSQPKETEATEANAIARCSSILFAHVTSWPARHSPANHICNLVLGYLASRVGHAAIAAHVTHIGHFAASRLEAQQQQHQDVQMFGADLLSQVMYLPNMSSAPNSASALLSSVQSPPASMATAAESGDTYARKRPRVTPPPLLAHAGGSGQASQVASPISPPHTAHGSPGLAGGVPLGNLVFAPAASTSPSPQRLPPVPSGTISPSSLSFGSNSSTSATAADIEAFTAAIQQPFMAALQLPTSVAQAQANPAMAAMTTMQPLTLPIVASTATAVDANALMFQQFATSQQQQQPIPLAQFLQAAGAISAVVPQHPPMGVMTAQQQQQQPLAMSMPAAPEPASTSWLPKLERVVPNEGPLQGGIEVTVLGTGFNESLTVQFGSVPAHTVYWSPNTLVCTVPPGTQPGPVPVVIKQVADLGLTDTNQAQAPPVTFTYKDGMHALDKHLQEFLVDSVFHDVGGEQQQQQDESGDDSAFDMSDEDEYSRSVCPSPTPLH
ncbi:hypothetical protein BCR44DRAFT_1463516 [Catenaria anguillulae PL171]|uniref:IPT/TIG domain-containing protein n=1 Tax=Catenaria anguillulae PL171 TaxID=765915 RepID=A0A1Y2HCW8_9FUNG|nr:hypothetical protein BCR44DRAFT_1463516 [Catenaria anguillulae PL171]